MSFKHFILFFNFPWWKVGFKRKFPESFAKYSQPSKRLLKNTWSFFLKLIETRQCLNLLALVLPSQSSRQKGVGTVYTHSLLIIMILSSSVILNQKVQTLSTRHGHWANRKILDILEFTNQSDVWKLNESTWVRFHVRNDFDDE